MADPEFLVGLGPSVGGETYKFRFRKLFISEESRNAGILRIQNLCNRDRGNLWIGLASGALALQRQSTVGSSGVIKAHTERSDLATDESVQLADRTGITSNTEHQRRIEGLVIEYWCSLGVWCLGFGAYCAVAAPRSLRI
jgi:hypothetical protein